ncbi:MAG: valine--tRNA ligase [Luminiphilus sp.]|jgi:valyl-tRNA synthetase
MDKNFSPADIEGRWYDKWESAGYFAPSGHGPAYCIPIPPPNVTGTLHMGHGFQQAIMDALIRYHRMRGHNTLWQVGTDHAGIATQMVVERQLEAEGGSREALGREAFVKRVWDWKEQSGGAITQQLRRLGTSPDWQRERFTMDPGLSDAVQRVFIALFEKGLIYRGHRLVNWDPKFHTAISDLEVVQEEEQGSLWHLRYPLSDGEGHLVVATTRPETMLGDTAVAVHPSDPRYQHLVGKTIDLPLTDRQIPIIADDYVDPEFGSGCVKITPAHDFNDYAMGERHNLPKINILTASAALNDAVPEHFRGLDRFVARDKVITELEALNLLDKIEPHALKVPRGDRSGAVIEPWLTPQWYVDAKKLAEPAIKAVEQGDIRFVPKQWENTYFAWMRDIQDWCISRQLWWGHRIPAWYDTDDNVYVGQSEAEIRRAYELPETLALTQDEDVLDTWFSSALWTFSTLGWPEENADLRSFHPASVLVTGFDIIFFWVARMIMMSLEFMGEVPFHTVYVHGLVRDGEGQKMSKSKGNVLDPIDLIDGIELEALIAKRTANLMQPQLAERIEKATRKQFPDGIPGYGTDALRYTFYSLASTGRDIKFDIGRMEGYRNFCNKIWNAARYVLSHTEGHDLLKARGTPSLADRWIRSRLQSTLLAVDDAVAAYRFDLAAQSLYDFVWNEFCDWYLELSKPVLWDEAGHPQALLGTRQTLAEVLEQALRMLHPFMPFVTEEIWQSVSPLTGATGDSIMLAPWPTPEPEHTDRDAEDEIEWMKGIIVAIRTIRSEANIPPATTLEVTVANTSELDRDRLQRNGTFLQRLSKSASIIPIDNHDAETASLMALFGELEVRVPMAGLVDVTAELTRLDKEIAKAEAEKARLNGKLTNAKFIERAPADIVAAERQKLTQVDASLKVLQQQRRQIEELRSA